MNNEKMRQALRALYDAQNGPPLSKYTKEWEEAMRLAKEALAETEYPATQEPEDQAQVDQWYLQDSRDLNGDFMLFWRKGGGYTTDPNQAEVFTSKDAFKLDFGGTQWPWPKAYIDSKSRPAVDIRYVKRADIKEALDASRGSV